MIELLNAADDNGACLRAHLPAEADTEALGAALAQVLRPRLKIWLQGNLGMGKTTLTRGLLRALGHEGKVKSPTYTLIEPYVVSRLDLYHFDFYRFNSPEEYLDAGLDEYFADQGVCIVEWPDKALPHLPLPDVEIRLGARDSGRFVEIDGRTDAGRTCVIELVRALRGANPAPEPD
ncbi:tRNA (adenosine(37)-N6)-threonylcarbamoyltransferase complex ATPase subunit type 1 TsaE [Thauera butanivorans]|uniref:tRNA (adenosine(37)-N6)-threonylcarbamoyltransferase complex ATPase subunit type 1 TsaE n=1 Tax=Thauera butanivorans TaxID=86174 RepID=UPI003AB74CF2